MELPHGQRWDIVGRRAVWFAISLAAIVLGVVVWATKGLNYGIDFQGGALLRYELERPAATDPATTSRLTAEVRQELAVLGLGASRGGHGFDRLPNVRREIQAIVNDKEKKYNGLIQGKAL